MNRESVRGKINRKLIHRERIKLLIPVLLKQSGATQVLDLQYFIYDEKGIS
jgi:hypothetical protein